MLNNGVVKLPIDNLIVDYRAREWCRLSYPDHPKGCPNYNHKTTCPPKVCLIENWCNLESELWFVVVSFNLQEHIERMLSLHPNWTERQAKCVLYWQPKVNKQLENEAKLFCAFKPLKYTTCPEAMGVNVIRTLRKMGFPIQPRPKDIVYKVALVSNFTGDIK